MNRIIDVLTEKGIKQIELAEALGVTKSSISQWCSNTIQPPLVKLHKIAEIIDCDISELLVPTKKKVIKE